jgi:hypothetical protein
MVPLFYWEKLSNIEKGVSSGYLLGETRTYKRIKSPIDNNKPTTSNNFFGIKQMTNKKGGCFPPSPAFPNPF